MMSARMGADFLMIPRKSALFSRGCKLILLKGVLCQVAAKAFAPQAIGYVLGSWLPKEYQVGRVGSKAIDFYAFS